MISKLAKNIAHFFVVQKIVEEPKEAIYAYGMELLLSDVLNVACHAKHKKLTSKIQKNLL